MKDEQKTKPGIAEDAYDLFLASIDADTRSLLTDNELRQIYADQVAKAKAEKKAAAKKSLTEKALHVAKVQEGLLPQAAADEADRQRRMNELVDYVVEMPPTGENGEISDAGLRIDGRIYPHGSKVTITRAQYDSIREMLFRTGNMELEFQGKGRRFRSWMMSRSGRGDGRFHIETNAEGVPV